MAEKTSRRELKKKTSKLFDQVSPREVIVEETGKGKLRVDPEFLQRQQKKEIKQETQEANRKIKSELKQKVLSQTGASEEELDIVKEDGKFKPKLDPSVNVFSKQIEGIKSKTANVAIPENNAQEIKEFQEALSKASRQTKNELTDVINNFSSKKDLFTEAVEDTFKRKDPGAVEDELKDLEQINEDLQGEDVEQAIEDIKRRQGEKQAEIAEDLVFSAQDAFDPQAVDETVGNISEKADEITAQAEKVARQELKFEKIQEKQARKIAKSVKGVSKQQIERAQEAPGKSPASVVRQAREEQLREKVASDLPKVEASEVPVKQQNNKLKVPENFIDKRRKKVLKDKASKKFGVPEDEIKITETGEGFKAFAETTKPVQKPKKDKPKKDNKEPATAQETLDFALKNNSKRKVDTTDIEGSIEEFLSPDRSVENFNRVSEEAIFAGADLIQSSQKLGEQVPEDILPELNPEVSITGETGPTSGEIKVGTALASAQQLERGNLSGAATTLAPGQTEIEKQRQQDVAEGVVAGPGTLGGFAIGGGGALLRTAESTEKFGQVAGSGFSQIQSQAEKNPGEFVASEVGEEIGETVATGGLGAFAPTVTVDPTPTIDVPTPETAQTAAAFAKGELGTRARFTKIDERAKPAVTKVETQTDPEAGTRTQRLEGFDPQGRIVAEGTRFESPVTRKEFVKEKIGDVDAKLTDALNPDAVGLGPGSLVPGEKVEPDLSPETGVEPDFEPSLDPSKPLPDSISVGKPLTITPEQKSGTESDFFQEPDTGQETLLETVQESIQTPDTTLDQSLSLETTPSSETDQITIQDLQKRILREPETPTTTTTGTPSGDLPEGKGKNDEDGLSPFLSDNRGEELKIQESVAADLLNLEDSDSKISDRNPLSLRVS